MQQVLHRTGDDIPQALADNDVAKAYFSIIKSIMEQVELPDKDDILADMTLEIDRIIEADRIVDWVNNLDIQNKMKIDMEDCMYEYMQQSNSFKLEFEAIDEILEKCIDIAQHRRP